MPNTSPQRKIIKSKEFIEESESSSEIEEYNILSRPKRNIILNNNVTINQFDQSDDDEDDEDFNDFSMSSRSGSSSSEDTSDNDNNEARSINEEPVVQSVNLNKKTIVKKEAKIKKEKIVKTETKSPAATKTKRTTLLKKNKIKKILNQKKLDSNKEIDKMLSTFKNVNKTQISKNKQRISNGYIGDMEHSNAHIYTGPFVKQNKHKTYSTYTVVGSQLPEESENVTKTTELLIPREKMQSIKDSSVENWTCSLCHGKPNSLEGLGPLFGPYRLNQPDDAEEKDEKEIWLHEGCAVWNSNIYIKDNQVFGISNCLKEANKLECNSCKKRGATLTCSKLDCTKSYHYPCAILSNCNLINDNLSIQCKIHSVKNIKR